MRGKVLLVVLLFGLRNVYGDGVSRDRQWNGDNNDGINDNDRNCTGDNDCDGIQDYDNEKYFYEPCDYSDDIECVRTFFGHNSDCKVIYHEDMKAVYRTKHTNYLPRINTTIVTTRDQITNLYGNITRFYINKKTNNLVMAVDFDGIFIQAKKLYFIVSRRGREPAVTADYANGTHAFTATAIFPLHKGKIEMKMARVTSFIPRLPTFYLGPKIVNSTDPAIAAAVAGLFADMPTAVQEYFLTEGPGFFLAYFQKYICDFGIPLDD